ncbi:hypothetical protein HZ326_1700 [Fusarium oxysporum f. sp. albedinis]|nr:hypothetical protein HZ326_1700 [Fusarium oxysporum f. sp. albedinis]
MVAAAHKKGHCFPSFFLVLFWVAYPSLTPPSCMYQPCYLQAPVFHAASGINTKSIPYNRLCCYVPT